MPRMFAVPCYGWHDSAVAKHRPFQNVSEHEATQHVCSHITPMCVGLFRRAYSEHSILRNTTKVRSSWAQKGGHEGPSRPPSFRWRRTCIPSAGHALARPRIASSEGCCMVGHHHGMPDT